MVGGSRVRKALCAHGCTAICCTSYGPSMDLEVARTMLDAVVQALSERWRHMNEKKPFQRPCSSCTAWPPPALSSSS